MADAKGLYFGGGNTGLATVVPGIDTRQASAIMENRRAEKMRARAAANAAREKARDETFKPFDSIEHGAQQYERMLADETTNALNNVYKSFESGNEAVARRDAKQAALMLNKKASASKIVATKIVGVNKLIDEDEFITDEAKEKYKTEIAKRGIYNEDGSLVNPLDVDMTKIEYGEEKFRPGESVNYNMGKVIKSVLEDASFQTLVETEIQNSDGDVQHLGSGVLLVNGKKVNVTKESLPYVSVTKDENGKTVMDVKPVEELMASGVVDVIMQDKHMERYVNDQVEKLYPDLDPSEVDEKQAEVVREVLKGYKGKGKYESKDLSKTMMKRRAAAKSGGDGGAENTANMNLWYNDLTSMDKMKQRAAAGYILGGSFDGGKIVHAEPGHKGLVITIAEERPVNMNELSDEARRQKAAKDKDTEDKAPTAEASISNKTIQAAASGMGDDAMEKNVSIRNLKGQTRSVVIDLSDPSQRDRLLNMYTTKYNLLKEGNSARHYEGLLGPTKVSESAGAKKAFKF